MISGLVKELFEMKFGQIMQFLRLHLEMLWPIDWLAGTSDRTGLPTVANVSTTALPWRELVNLLGWISPFLELVTWEGGCSGLPSPSFRTGSYRYFEFYFCLINFVSRNIVTLQHVFISNFHLLNIQHITFLVFTESISLSDIVSSNYLL